MLMMVAITKVDTALMEKMMPASVNIMMMMVMPPPVNIILDILDNLRPKIMASLLKTPHLVEILIFCFEVVNILKPPVGRLSGLQAPP